MSTEKMDIGLSIHRITQIIITGACMALLYLSRSTYEEVDGLGKDMSAVRVSVDTHGGQINEMRMDIRELQQDIHEVNRTIQKPKRK